MTAYKDAGVDVEAGDLFVEGITDIANATNNQFVIGGLGGFGGMIEIPSGYKRPVLVSGADGVGTKVQLACEWDMLDDIGQDLVAMCVNDIIVQGAQPFYFMDYFATGKLEPTQATRVVMSIARACEDTGMVLLGGETAEMPGMYKPGEFDLAGFAVGIVEFDDIITGNDIKQGDVLIGLESSGLHSNGFSLVRKILEDHTVSKEFVKKLLTGTKLYDGIIGAINPVVNGVAHITGGGVLANINRMIPEGLEASVEMWSWHMPHIFDDIQRMGHLNNHDMLTTFNCGLGMVIAVDPHDVIPVQTMIRQFNTQSSVIGKVR